MDQAIFPREVKEALVDLRRGPGPEEENRSGSRCFEPIQPGAGNCSSGSGLMGARSANQGWGARPSGPPIADLQGKGRTPPPI